MAEVYTRSIEAQTHADNIVINLGRLFKMWQKEDGFRMQEKHAPSSFFKEFSGVVSSLMTSRRSVDDHPQVAELRGFMRELAPISFWEILGRAHEVAFYATGDLPYAMQVAAAMQNKDN